MARISMRAGAPVRAVARGAARAATCMRRKMDGLIIRAGTDARMTLGSLMEPKKGAITAEYVIVLVAATGFAAVLAALLKSSAVKSQLAAIVAKALKAAS